MKIRWVYGGGRGFWISCERRFWITPVRDGRLKPQRYRLRDKQRANRQTTWETVAEAKSFANEVLLDEHRKDS